MKTPDLNDTIKALETVERARLALMAISLHGIGLGEADHERIRSTNVRLTRLSMDLVEVMDEQFDQLDNTTQTWTTGLVAIVPGEKI